MPALIDLHCHVLPGIDDGARDLDDAVRMGLQAQHDGIAAVCATPHIRHDHDVRISELPRRVADLEAALREAACRTRILAGGEVAATAIDELDDDELAAVALGGGRRWILLEPAPGPLDDSLDGAVERLRVRGFRSVVAHPERHAGEDLVLRLRRLVARGALIQVTAASLIDKRSSAVMIALARAGVLHVLGSDAHSSHFGRPVALSSALEILASAQPTADHVDWIARTAPEAIVRGTEVGPPF
jgi:protein-tyrosine phosphatase